MDNHLRALQHKHDALKKEIRAESRRLLPNDDLLTRIKRQKLSVKEEIDRLQRGG